MADIQVWLDTGRRDPYQIDAPSDIPVREFIAELRSSLNVGDTGQFLYCSELGRQLDESRTLEANGVNSGDHLVFGRDIPKPVRVPPPQPPVQRDLRWLWIAAAVFLFLLVLWLS